jgi:MAE_28990/MAE_18760-like HEPN
MNPYFVDIENDINTRLRELDKLDEIRGLLQDNSQKKFIDTYAALIMYAIWENFLKNALETYIKILDACRINRTDLHPNLQIFWLENNFQNLKNYGQITNKATFLQDLESLLSIPTVNLFSASISELNMKDNLNFVTTNAFLDIFNIQLLPERLETNFSSEVFDVLRALYPILNSNPRIYELKNELKEFLHYRNNIGHGNLKKVSIRQTEIPRFKFLVTFLMTYIFEQMQVAFDNQTYLK